MCPVPCSRTTAQASSRDVGERKQERQERKREERKSAQPQMRTLEKIPFEELEIMSTLGTGTFGRVRDCGANDAAPPRMCASVDTPSAVAP